MKISQEPPGSQAGRKNKSRTDLKLILTLLAGLSALIFFCYLFQRNAEPSARTADILAQAFDAQKKAVRTMDIAGDKSLILQEKMLRGQEEGFDKVAGAIETQGQNLAAAIKTATESNRNLTAALVQKRSSSSSANSSRIIRIEKRVEANANGYKNLANRLARLEKEKIAVQPEKPSKPASLPSVDSTSKPTCSRYVW